MPRQAELIHLRVAAGILRNAYGQVLICERIGDGPFRGLWEFPGGKIGDGESPHAALVRELDEEIGIQALSCEPFMSLDHEYPDRRVSIQFFLIEAWRNEPRPLEGQGLKWVAAGELPNENLLPADVAVIEALLADA